MPNLYLIVLLISFFLLLSWIIVENRTELKKLFIWATRSSGTQHRKHTKCTWLLISNCYHVRDILDWTWFLYISDCRNSVNKKLQNLWTIKKLGKTAYVYWYVFPFHVVQYANTEFVIDDNGVFTTFSKI